MDIEAILQDLRARPGYRGEIVEIRSRDPRPARFADPARPLSEPLRRALAARGIERLYSHQAEVLDALEAGEDVILATGPASGKSLAYQLPILARRGADPEARSLLLFPAKALARDQLRSLERLAADVEGLDLACGAYDGDTPAEERRRLRDRAGAILANPDVLHATILAQHPRWARFFANLSLVVIDEAHVYTGLFGANVANLMRRLRRVLRHYGADPRIILSSSTLPNAAELAEKLTGRSARVIDRDGAPAGRRVFVLWNPPIDRPHGRYRRRSANVEAMRLLARLVRRGARTIVFSKARITAELIYRYATERLARAGSPDAERIAVYRGGYLPAVRREIERRLFAGELVAVSATPALELGIDVGGLEASIIVGYPGRRASFFQQAGRAGRRGEDALAILVGLDTAINQFVMRRPGYLFDRPIEAAAVEPDNPYVVADHLRAACAELPLPDPEVDAFGPNARAAIEVLGEKGKVRAIGGVWYHATPEIPHHGISLRATSLGNVLIVEPGPRGERTIGEVDRYDAQPIVHPHAIYIHRGETYEVEKLDLDRNKAIVRKIDVDYYTQPNGGTNVDHIDAPLRERPFGPARAFFGEVTAYSRTYAYEKVRFYELEARSRHPLDLPVEWFETHALWVEAPEGLMREVFATGLDAYSGLRGIGYALRMILPLFVTCDTLDLSHSVGARNSPWHTVFIYERHPYGLGVTEKAYERLEEILRAAEERIRDCDCADGCPCCVGKPLRTEADWNVERHEGSIPSRQAALRILEGLLEAAAIGGSAEDPRRAAAPAEPAAAAPPIPLSLRLGIRRRLERMRLASALHPVDPAPETGYPAPEVDPVARLDDATRRAAHRMQVEEDARRRARAVEETDPPLPEAVERALPPKPLPEVGKRDPAAQAARMARDLDMAGEARRRARERGEGRGPCLGGGRGL
ncbi:MAG: DEAD/DEAH box helicase [Planctomycetes bacterium]|nr:DEAD/DEAH box helicase [Planctomycetota bacterium]